MAQDPESVPDEPARSSPKRRHSDHENGIAAIDARLPKKKMSPLSRQDL